METIMHTLGLCPDSANHLDLTDLLTSNLIYVTEFINQLKTIYHVFKSF